MTFAVYAEEVLILETDPTEWPFEQVPVVGDIVALESFVDLSETPNRMDKFISENICRVFCRQWVDDGLLVELTVDPDE